MAHVACRPLLDAGEASAADGETRRPTFLGSQAHSPDPAALGRAPRSRELGGVRLGHWVSWSPGIGSHTAREGAVAGSRPRFEPSLRGTGGLGAAERAEACCPAHASEPSREGRAARAPGASPATAPRAAGLGSRPALRRGRPRTSGASRGNGSYPHETVVGSLTRRVPHSRACRWTEGAVLGAGCCGGSREQTGGEQAHRRVEGAAGAGRAARPSSLCWKRQDDEPVAPSVCSRAVTGMCDESTAEARASCRCRYSPDPKVRPGCGPQRPAA